MFVVSCEGVINMLLVLSMFITIYGIVCVQLAHSSIGDWKDISVGSEVSTIPVVIIFSIVLCLRCLLHHVLLLILYKFRENRKFVFIIIVQCVIGANIRISFGISLSSLCKLIWRHYKMPVRYIFECGSKIKHILSIIHYEICGAVFSV